MFQNESDERLHGGILHMNRKHSLTMYVAAGVTCVTLAGIFPAVAKPQYANGNRVDCDNRYLWTCDVRGWGKEAAAKSRRTFHARGKTRARHAHRHPRRAHAEGVRRAERIEARQDAPNQERALDAPRRFTRWVLGCARNVNMALAEMGIRGTGSDLAKSFLHWGHSSRPRPGAVVVWNRGHDPRKGHAAIVSRVVGGRVYVWNPSHRRGRWVETVIHRTPIAYRYSG